MSSAMRSSGRFVRALRVAVLVGLIVALPATVVAQASYTWRNVEIVGGGYVPGIVFNPSEPDLIYARTDIGGAYRWNPGTNRWVPLLDWLGFDDWNLTGVDSLATDPVDPNRLYILAGTYINSWTSQNGAILRSTNRGNTFERINLPFKSGGNMPGRNMGERLVIDPNQNGILYLGTRTRGLWRSTNFGTTWAQLTNFPDLGPFAPNPTDPNDYLNHPIGVVWVAFDKATGTPGSPTQTTYVGTAQNGSGLPNVFRSTNGGATWAAIPGEPVCTQSGSIVTCTGGATWDRNRLSDSGARDWDTGGYLPHHGVVASNGTLYITYNNWEGPYNGNVGDVWKFSPATGAWTKISPLPGSDSSIYFGYGGLAVDAQDPDVVMVAALNSWWPDTILFRSTDAGATWTRIWDWAGFPARTLRYTQNITGAPWLVLGDLNPQPPVPSPKLGWMVGDLEIDPFDSDRLLYGTGATIYGTDNLTAWDTGGTIAVSVRAQGLEETAVLDLISPPSGANLLSALGDINGFRHDNLNVPPSRIFTTPTTASSTSIDFAELTPNFIVRSGHVNKALNPSVNRAGFSFDGGSNWFQGQEPGGVTGGGTVAAAANASRVLWSPDGTGVHVSTNNGSSWTAATGIPAGAIVESDRVNPLKFYGWVGGAFYVSTNGGVSFAASPATGLPGSGAEVHVRFKAVPGREGDVWLAGGAENGVYGLWHSTNSGASFTRLANVEEADTIGFGMPAPGQTYPALYSSAQIAGVRGLFRSDDAGATWIRINDNARQWGSTNAAITGDPRVYGRVYVSTNGRGIILGEPANIPDFSLAASPNSLIVNRGASVTSTITITRTGGFTGSVVFSASGLPGGVTAAFTPASTPGNSATLTLTASATATAGPATVTVTGLSGALTRTAAIGLTVNAPDFTLATPNPASLTINRGASGTSAVSLNRLGGFTGAVTFSASGLPAGVTAAFSPNPVSTGTGTTVTLTASSTAATGPATVTITGASGGVSRTTSLGLTVAAPDFSLNPPCSITAAPGGSGSCVVNITRTGGFTGAVAFSASGLPAGATASFSPASTTGGSTTLTISVASGTAAGTSSFTISGIGGGLTRTVPGTLTVTGAGNFSLSASPGSLTVNRGSSGTSTVTITRTGGFTTSVGLAASGLPAGVTASFNPASTTGNSSVLTLAVSGTATLGTATVTLTGTGAASPARPRWPSRWPIPEAATEASPRRPR